MNGAGSVHIAGPGALPGDSFSGYTAFGGNGSSRWGDYSTDLSSEVDKNGILGISVPFFHRHYQKHEPLHSCGWL